MAIKAQSSQNGSTSFAPTINGLENVRFTIKIHQLCEKIQSYVLIRSTF